MKKIAVLLAMLYVLPFASATAFVNVGEDLNLFEKNPSDWSIVEGGAYGRVVFSDVSIFGKIIQQRIRVIVYGLEPKTEYQLIYYGNEVYNDVWNYATCIGNSVKTSTQGFFKSGSSQFNHLDMANDGIAQKLWVFLGSHLIVFLYLLWQPYLS